MSKKTNIATIDSDHQILMGNHPVVQQQRTKVLDVMRGFALLGILIMNIQAFSMIFSAYANPYAFGDMTGLNYWARWFSMIFADQKFFSIFSILFGAGIALMAQKNLDKGVKPLPIHYRRMGWLVILGGLHVMFLWAGDILLSYAFTGLFAVLFYRCKAFTLLSIGLALVILYAVLMLSSGVIAASITAEDMVKINQFWWPSQSSIDADIVANTASWAEQWQTRIDLYLALNNNFLLFFLRILGLMLLGMGLYKADWLNAIRSKNTYILHATPSLIVGFSLCIYGQQQLVVYINQPLQVIFFTFIYGYIGSLAVAWGYICLVQWFYLQRPQCLTCRCLASVGQMALSNYLFQSIVCGLLFYGWGLGLYGSVTRIEQMGIVVGIWVLQIIWSSWWLNHFAFGPFEWLWRSLTYWQRQPLLNRTGLA